MIIPPLLSESKIIPSVVLVFISSESIVKPPIEPLSVLIWVAITSPLNIPDVAVISPVIFAFEAVICPFAFNLNPVFPLALLDLISDEFNVNPPMFPILDDSVPLIVKFPSSKVNADDEINKLPPEYWILSPPPVPTLKLPAPFI